MFFHALIFVGSQGSLNMIHVCQVFRFILKDPAKVNAMTKACMVSILAFHSMISLKTHQKMPENHTNGSQGLVYLDIILWKKELL